MIARDSISDEERQSTLSPLRRKEAYPNESSWPHDGLSHHAFSH
jgi:hypothetical protein